ncbi:MULTISPECIES: GyrI-like domain-containing protein [Clostridium]|uniref:GyrI-like domain-containing protein n=1 Tax=Clostridium TaxID=1485 RepID=UPI001E068A5B|nr:MULTISPECIES: GyrI-like domain-containing protein [Clostridium]MDU4476748.1 GyrI-like domain-containing protein [Clostridium sp.]CAG9713209.1 Putative transcriptional regulator [Clostridium neonatale]
MNYEIVNLKEKKVAGLNIRTNNNDPNMNKNIGELWNKFFKEGIFTAIENKINDKTIGLYSDYESDYNGDYDMSVGCEISNDEKIPTGTILKIIPAGNYAKFVVKGQMQKAVYEFWQKLWQMNLERAYTCDFEEYINTDIDNAEIHIYISLK